MSQNRISFLRPKDIEGAMLAGQAPEMVIGGVVDLHRNILTLVRASDLQKVVVPLSEFTPSGDGTKPDFNDFEITDSGFTIRFGQYEAAARSILY